MQIAPFLRFTVVLSLLVLFISVGTIGYTFIEGWPILDSLYMTLITITTVGYGEVQPLSLPGKQFTVFLLILGVMTVGYSATTAIGFVFEEQILRAVRRRRMTREIDRLKDHYIICGCGVVGREVALEMKRAKAPFVIVEQDPEGSELGRDASVAFVPGDATDDETLIAAGVERARGLISVLRNDESNVFVVLTSRQLNPNLTIVSRTAEERTIGKLIKAGADRVMSPYQVVGRRIASVVLQPSVVDFVDVVLEGRDVSMRFKEIAVADGSRLVGKSVKEADVGHLTGAIVVGIHGKDGRPRVDPAEVALSAVTLQQGDVLMATGNEAQLERLKAIAS